MRLSPQLLIAGASAFAGLDCDTAIETILTLQRDTGAPPGSSWDVAILHHWGYWSHYDDRGARSWWPLPAVHDANALAEFAQARNALTAHAERGDIFLQYSPFTKCFVRAGVIVEIQARGVYGKGKPYCDVLTIEGNTNLRGEPDGPRVLRVARRFSPVAGDRFLRWADLDPYAPLGSGWQNQAMSPNEQMEAA